LVALRGVVEMERLVELAITNVAAWKAEGTSDATPKLEEKLGIVRFERTDQVRVAKWMDQPIS
jgi:hypothetical protein